MNQFSIHADRYWWIDGSQDDPTDRCLHGHVIAQIGHSYRWSLSQRNAKIIRNWLRQKQTDIYSKG